MTTIKPEEVSSIIRQELQKYEKEQLPRRQRIHKALEAFTPKRSGEHREG